MTVDAAFIAKHRALGHPDTAIARMGGWCVQDVRDIPRCGDAIQRAPPAKPPPLRAADHPEVMEIITHVAESYCITPGEILGQSLDPLTVEARHEAIAVAWELNRFSTQELAELFRKSAPGITYALERHYERLRGRNPYSTERVGRE